MGTNNNLYLIGAGRFRFIIEGVKQSSGDYNFDVFGPPGKFSSYLGASGIYITPNNKTIYATIG